MEAWSSYFRKPIIDRQRQLLQLLEKGSADEEDGKIVKAQTLLDRGGLSVSSADTMIENCVGLLNMPLGVAPYFLINSKNYVVPMVTEEPSVIAAASSAAKLIAQAGGFKATSTRQVMIGQIHLVEAKNDDFDAAKATLEAEKDKLITAANEFCPGMKARGGGVIGMDVRILSPRRAEPTPTTTEGASSTSPRPGRTAVVHFHVDVCDAMGANLVNRIVEGMAPQIEKVTGGRVGMKILSNLCLERRTRATFQIPVKLLAWKHLDGAKVASLIMEAYNFARDDPFRATTHNKGIMNGVDAVALATGQDWRAIEAGAHAYAALGGSYKPLSHYQMASITGPEGKEDALEASLEIPIAVGTIGGSIATHPICSITHQLLGNPDAKTLAQIHVCVGLASNFSAMRAIVVEGINKGHMELHARKERRRSSTSLAQRRLSMSTPSASASPVRVERRSSTSPSPFRLASTSPSPASAGTAPVGKTGSQKLRSASYHEEKVRKIEINFTDNNGEVKKMQLKLAPDRSSTAAIEAAIRNRFDIPDTAILRLAATHTKSPFPVTTSVPIDAQLRSGTYTLTIAPSL